MDRELLAARLREAATTTRDFTRQYIEEELPDEIVFRVRLNASYDGNPLHTDERVFPDDSSEEVARKLLRVSATEVVDTLWREKRVPEWVNLTVIGRSDSATLMEVLSCGRFTDNDQLLYHQGEGYPPFHALGPALPLDWKEGQKFSLYYRAEAASWAEVELLAPHSAKVWSLELQGRDFDDDALVRLPRLPAVEIIELKGCSIAGAGLARLGRHRKLRVLRAHLVDPDRFQLPKLFSSKTMEAATFANLPVGAWGFEQVSRAWPRLEWLDLSGASSIELGGRFPKRLQSLSIGAAELTGDVRLPSELDSLSLHLTDVDDTDLERLLQPLRTVRAFHFQHTPIGAGIVSDVVRRCRPEYINVVDTRMTQEEVDALLKEHPTLRAHPRRLPDDLL